MPASVNAAYAASAMRSGSDSFRFPNRVIPAPEIQTSATRSLSGSRPPSVNVLRGGRDPSRERLAMRDVHTELADEPQEIRALQPERARRARAVAAELEKRGLDQSPLELGDGAVVTGRRLGRARRWSGGERGRCRHAARYGKARATPRSRTFRGDDEANSPRAAPPPVHAWGAVARGNGHARRASTTRDDERRTKR